MPTFNAGDVIGKTLIAKKNIPLVRQPADDAVVIYNVAPGQSVGNVDTFLLPNENRSSLYWSCCKFKILLINSKHNCCCRNYKC